MLEQKAKKKKMNDNAYFERSLTLLDSVKQSYVNSDKDTNINIVTSDCF